MSGNNGAAKAGSLCMKVPNIIIQSPISSSLYSSLTIPHSEHRCVTHSSPILKELCLVSVPSGFGNTSALNQVPGLLGSCVAYEFIANGPTFLIRCRWFDINSPRNEIHFWTSSSYSLIRKHNVNTMCLEILCQVLRICPPEVVCILRGLIPSKFGSMSTQNREDNKIFCFLRKPRLLKLCSILAMRRRRRRREKNGSACLTNESTDPNSSYTFE